MRDILVSCEPGETRSAVLEDGALVEFLIERPQTQRVSGNVYKGKVENVLPGMEAAFVNVGLERNAFLYAGDARLIYGEDDVVQDSRQRIQDLVKVGQEVLVQVVKEPVGTKGARVSTNIGFPGRFLVLTPLNDFVGVSHRITDEEERQRLRTVAQEIKPEGMGVIVRTVAEGHDRTELQHDVDVLHRLWEDVRRRMKQDKAPSLVHQDMGLTFRMVRDFMTEDVRHMRIDSRDEYRRVQRLIATISPDLKKKVRHFKGKDIFGTYGIKADLERAMRRKVWLKSGGSIVIDHTEALTVIDVNTGKYVGKKSLQETILKTNIEAAGEIARQVRLRDISGIIVIDFIDMEEQQARESLVQTLQEAVKADRTKVHVVGITKLGLVEITRKRVGGGIMETSFSPCPTCEGRGLVQSDDAISLRVRRELRELLIKQKDEAVLVEANPAIASLLIGTGGANLKELEKDTQRTVFIRGNNSVAREEFVIRASGARAEVQRLACPVAPGDVLEVTVEGAHLANGEDGIARIEGYVINIERAGGLVGKKVRIQVGQTFKTYAKAKLAQ